jgi:hypothetical protein
MNAIFEQFEKYVLENDQMSKINGGERYIIIDGKPVLVLD